MEKMTIFCNFASMYQENIHKGFSMAIAWLVLLSTITFTLEKHFCGDVLIDTAIFSKAESCCNLEVLAMAEKKSCCKEEVEVIRGQDSLKKAIFEDLHNDQQIVLVTFYYSYYNLFEGLPVQFIPHKNYSPPLLVTDIQILDQVFII